MRPALLSALVVAVTGCAHVYPVAMYGHISDPSRGRPFNQNCDPTADFAGGGVGLEHGNNRAYIALGQKLVRTCDSPGLPHVDDRSLGGMGIFIHEFRKR